MTKDEPLKLSFDVTIDTKRIDTGFAKRDEDVRSEGFFDVAKFPRISVTVRLLRELHRGTTEEFCRSAWGQHPLAALGLKT
jgi:polyisoprenoid-binding protein YceI